MLNLFEARITNPELLTRPMWPETEEGAMYRELLVTHLSESSGFLYRAFPQPHVVHNVFGTVDALTQFLQQHKAFMAEMMSAADAYYRVDSGCQAGFSVVKVVSGSDPVTYEVTDLSDPEQYVV